MMKVDPSISNFVPRDVLLRHGLPGNGVLSATFPNLPDPSNCHVYEILQKLHRVVRSILAMIKSKKRYPSSANL